MPLFYFGLWPLMFNYSSFGYHFYYKNQSVDMLKKIMLCILLLFVSNVASANIALSKYRLYFDHSNRSDALQLRNTSSGSISFSVELGLVAMTEEGVLRAVEEDKNSAIGLLRYSPKRGKIKAGERQALRFVFRKPADFPEGEYRAVLKITSSDDAASGSAVSIRPKLSYSVPIIVRNGQLQASTELLAPRLVMVGGTPTIELWQKLEGNRSLFGNFTVSDQSGNEIGLLRNSAVYLPLNKRKVLIKLKAEPKGKVIIDYKEIAKYGGNLSARTEIELN